VDQRFTTVYTVMSLPTKKHPATWRQAPCFWLLCYACVITFTEKYCIWRGWNSKLCFVYLYHVVGRHVVGCLNRHMRIEILYTLFPRERFATVYTVPIPMHKMEPLYCHVRR